MPAKVKLPSQVHLDGTILGFNVSSSGHIEGALVDTSKGHEQINFPKHETDTLRRAMHVGSKVDFDVEVETHAGDHCVYRLCDELGQASGKVTRLNYALHGVVNGYHLDDATFLHVKPDGAKKYNVRVGESVRATGVRRAGPHAVVLEVRTLERVERLGRRHD